MQMICIWSSWCHCHPIISRFIKIQNSLSFWCQLNQVVLEKRPINRCCSSVVLRSLSSLSSVFCCRAGSGYPNGYPVLGNSWGGFPLPSSRFVITYCDQSFPSPWHCLSAAPSLSGATLLSTLEGVPYLQPGDAGGRQTAPAVCQSLTSADPTRYVYRVSEKRWLGVC